MWKRLFVFVLCAMLVPFFAACERQDDVIQLAEVTHSVFYAPQYVAMELGYFKNEGLTIELTNAGGADKAMAMLLSGQADIGFMGPEAAIYVHKEGRKDSVAVIGQVTIRDGQFLFGREADDNFTWDSLAGESIIGGRRGGVPCMTLEHVLRQKGLIPGQDVDVRTDVQFNLMGGAFAGGEGDFVTLFEPSATEAEDAGVGYILASVGAEAGPVAYTCYMVPKSAVKDNADTLTRFLKALYKGQQYVKTHSDAEVAQALAPAFPDSNVESLTKVVKRYREIGAWVESPLVDQQSIENLQAIMIEAGELDGPVNYDDLVYNTLANKAIGK